MGGHPNITPDVYASLATAKLATAVRIMHGMLGRLRAGEQTLLKWLPDLGSPKANWAQNSSALRQIMRLGQPIRDATVDAMGALINNTGFLRAGRYLLESRGWSYDAASRMWHPPGAP
jgi:hypothetical protein